METKIFHTEQTIILATGSSRRHDFFQQLGIEFEICPAEIDETPFSDEDPEKYALRLAEGKAAAVAAEHQGAWVIGADTVVTLDGHILGKPHDSEQALAMLAQLSGHTHRVITAYSLICRAQNISVVRAATTEVKFHSFPASVLEGYIRTGEPMDKAGAYGIQGIGGFLVKEVCGSVSNVIGLPLSEVVEELLSHGVIASP